MIKIIHKIRIYKSQIDRQTYGWRDGWMDRQTDREEEGKALPYSSTPINKHKINDEIRKSSKSI